MPSDLLLKFSSRGSLTFNLASGKEVPDLGIIVPQDFSPISDWHDSRRQVAVLSKNSNNGKPAGMPNVIFVLMPKSVYGQRVVKVTPNKSMSFSGQASFALKWLSPDRARGERKEDFVQITPNRQFQPHGGSNEEDHHDYHDSHPGNQPDGTSCHGGLPATPVLHNRSGTRLEKLGMEHALSLCNAGQLLWPNGRSLVLEKVLGQTNY